MKKRVILHFPPNVTGQPVIYYLAKDFNLVFNIIKASVSPGQAGSLVLELSGEHENYQGAIRFLTEVGVTIESADRNIIRNETKCTHCGACVTFCSVDAFSLDQKTRRILFDQGKCVLCGFCVVACPPRAMELHS